MTKLIDEVVEALKDYATETGMDPEQRERIDALSARLQGKVIVPRPAIFGWGSGAAELMLVYSTVEKAEQARALLAAGEDGAVSLLRDIELLCCVCPVEYDETYTPEAAKFWEQTAENIAERISDYFDAAPPATVKGDAQHCAWYEDGEGDGVWATECKRHWYFTEGSPQDNGIKFCFGCGKPVDFLSDEPSHGHSNEETEFARHESADKPVAAAAPQAEGGAQEVVASCPRCKATSDADAEKRCIGNDDCPMDTLVFAAPSQGEVEIAAQMMEALADNNGLTYRPNWVRDREHMEALYRLAASALRQRGVDEVTERAVIPDSMVNRTALAIKAEMRRQWGGVQGPLNPGDWSAEGGDLDLTVLARAALNAAMGKGEK